MNSKYIVIYQELVKKIEEGIYPVDSKIPSEKDLMEQFCVSRDTIRKSLQMLEQNGYINKIKGRGSFVLDTSKFDFPVSGLVSFKELASHMGTNVGTIVEEFDSIKPTKFIQEQLQVENIPVWKVLRVRKIDGVRIILDKEFYHGELIEGLTKEICQNSIFEYIENTLSLKIGFAKKEIVAESCTEEDRKYLDLEGFDMVVVVNTYVHLDDGTIIQYGQSRHRPDKFKFVDFARRMHQDV